MRRLLVAVLIGLTPIAAWADLLKPGAPFPAWKMKDQAGVEVTSESLAGKTYLLWFYPKAMTPGCTAEGQGLRDRYPEFQAKGVEILGVSFDEPAANAAFVVYEKFPFKLLSDSDHALAAEVGAATSRDQSVASRISYLVGPDGKVLRVYDDVSPSAHAQQVLTDLH